MNKTNGRSTFVETGKKRRMAEKGYLTRVIEIRVIRDMYTCDKQKTEDGVLEEWNS